MLNHDSQESEDVRKKWNYSQEDRLAYDRIRVYMLREELRLKEGNKRKTKEPTMCKADINPIFGIELASFDETIDEMNAIQEALYYGLGNNDRR